MERNIATPRHAFVCLALLVSLSPGLSSCTTGNERQTTPQDIVERLEEVPDEKVCVGPLHSRQRYPGAENERSVGYRWYDLCAGKNCDRERVSYSRTFRSAAVLAATMHYLESVAEEVVRGALTAQRRRLAIRYLRVELPALYAEITDLRTRLEKLDPMKDFAEEERLRRVVVDWLEEALAQVREAGRRTARISSAVGSLEADHAWDDCAEPRRIEALARRLVKLCISTESARRKTLHQSSRAGKLDEFSSLEAPRLECPACVCNP